MAMEHAVGLTNALRSLLIEKGDQRPSSSEINTALRTFNISSLPRAKKLYKISYYIVRLITRSSGITRFVNLTYLLSNRPFFLWLFSTVVEPGTHLDFIPVATLYPLTGISNKAIHWSYAMSTYIYLLLALPAFSLLYMYIQTLGR